jgi:hypothetical protein
MALKSYISPIKENDDDFNNIMANEKSHEMDIRGKVLIIDNSNFDEESKEESRTH